MVVKTSCFQCRGCGFDPWLGKEDLSCCQVQHKSKKKKKSEVFPAFSNIFNYFSQPQTSTAAGLAQQRGGLRVDHFVPEESEETDLFYYWVP